MLEEGRSFSGRERHCCFLNTAGPRFANISAVSGLDYPDDGRALSLVDWDHDGDYDLWISNRNAPRLRFLRNDAAEGNHFLALRLLGNGQTTNRDAIGARIEVVTAADDQGAVHRQIKTLRAGEGFLAQSSKWILFGLGAAERIERLTVRWPGGELEEFPNLPVDGRYILVQGTGRAESAASQRQGLALSPAPPRLPKQSGTVRVRLAAPVLMPADSVYRDFKEFDGPPRPLPMGQGDPLLVILWASWCQPCVSELSELTRRASDIQATGLKVVALSVDGLGEDDSDPAAARQLLGRLQFPFTGGWADPNFVKAVQAYYNQLVVLAQPLPIPTSFLIDGSGHLSVIYKGAVSVEALLKDLSQIDSLPADRWRFAACLPGSTIEHERIAQAKRKLQIRTRLHLAEALRKAGRLQDAAAHFAELLEIAPRSAQVHQNLALVYEQLGQPEQAIAHYRQAIQLGPRRAWLYYNLANVLNRQRKFDEAVAAYRRAIKLKSDYPEAHVNLGSVLVKLNRYQEAKTHFEAALKLDPELIPARENLRRLRAIQPETR